MLHKIHAYCTDPLSAELLGLLDNIDPEVKHRAKDDGTTMTVAGAYLKFRKQFRPGHPPPMLMCVCVFVRTLTPSLHNPRFSSLALTHARAEKKLWQGNFTAHASDAVLSYGHAIRLAVLHKDLVREAKENQVGTRIAMRIQITFLRSTFDTST